MTNHGSGCGLMMILCGKGPGLTGRFFFLPLTGGCRSAGYGDRLELPALLRQLSQSFPRIEPGKGGKLPRKAKDYQLRTTSIVIIMTICFLYLAKKFWTVVMVLLSVFLYRWSFLCIMMMRGRRRQLSAVRMIPKLLLYADEPKRWGMECN